MYRCGILRCWQEIELLRIRPYVAAVFTQYFRNFCFTVHSVDRHQNALSAAT